MEHNKLNITEKDIFNFVFYPDSIPDEAKDYIKKNKDFQEAINFYSGLKSELGNVVSDEEKRILKNKIRSYSTDHNYIELFAIEERANNQNRVNLLAAASISLDPQITTRTFIDEDKEYLIKVLNYGNKTKVFVFSTNNQQIKNFDVIIEPENRRYHMEDNSEPLKINQLIDPPKISLKFNN